MKLAVVTDSTAFLPESVKSNKDLSIIPIPVIIDGKLYNEGIDIEADTFYSLLKNSEQFPTTSQPSMGELLELYEELGSKGYDTILSIHLSSGISGFVNNLNSLKDHVKDVNIIPFDSKFTSMPMGHMVQVALEMNETGASLDEIIQRLEIIRENTHAYIIVDDLNNLVRGGRLTNGAALIGGLLKIKPILRFEDGKIVLFEKIRSSKKAFVRAKEILGEIDEEMAVPFKINIIHANNLEVAEQEKEALLAAYPDIEVEIGYFGPVIGTHLGDKAIGFIISAQ